MKGGLLVALTLCVATLAVDLPHCPTDVEDPAIPVYLPYPDDCTKFIGCTHGEAVVLTCPEGLHFNAETSSCDWPEDAGCQAVSTEGPIDVSTEGPIDVSTEGPIDVSTEGPIDVSTEGPVIPTEGPETNLPSECPNPGDVNEKIRLPHETSCNKFWSCNVDGTKGLYSCSMGQAFSKDLRKCVDIWETKCTRS